MRTLLISLACLMLVGCAGSQFEKDRRWLDGYPTEEMNATQRMEHTAKFVLDILSTGAAAALAPR
jgi:hypothetical protein